MRLKTFLTNFRGNAAALLALAVMSLPCHAITYLYDDAGRLTAAVYENGSAVRYAYDTAGNIISVSSLQVPAAPDEIAATQTSEGALITWTDNASNEIGYIVQRRSAKSDDWNNIATLSSGSTSYLDPGVVKNNNFTYRVVARGSSFDSAYSLASTISELSPRIVNLSSRAKVGFGDEVMIAGFFIGGENSKEVVIRAVGPTLKTLIPTFQGEIRDPAMTLLDSSQNVIASNDDWGNQPNKDAINQAFGLAGAFPLDENGKDSALLVDLKPGLYSAIISSKTSQGGIALAEIYDLSGDAKTRLLNISTRVKVGEGDSVLIGGFVVRKGDPSKFLIRAAGPELTKLGLPGALSDPQITLFRGSEFIASNDDWGDAANAGDIPDATFSVGGFPLTNGSADAVLLVDLEPGIYSASVSGVNGATGIAIIEIYAVP